MSIDEDEDCSEVVPRRIGAAAVQQQHRFRKRITSNKNGFVSTCLSQ